MLFTQPSYLACEDEDGVGGRGGEGITEQVGF